MTIVANFKANHTRASTLEYIDRVEKFLQDQDRPLETIVLPSASALCERVSLVEIGAQNCWISKSGAFTGEICTEQLDEFGIKTILIGHSERRELFGESQELIDEKFEYFKELGYCIIYCIGEPLEVREDGVDSLLEYLDSQLDGIDTTYKNLLIAYEPIWAIGSGVTPESREIELVHRALAQKVKAPILYGGSVKKTNAHEILSLEHVSGALIGSGALNVDDFCSIINIATQIKERV